MEYCYAHEAKREELVKAEAARIMREHPPSSFPEFDPSDGSSFEEWSEESFGYVKDGTVYGGIEPGDAPDKAYTEKARKLTERRVALGGYRLAAVLNANLVAPTEVACGLVGWVAFLSALCVILLAAIGFMILRQREWRVAFKNMRGRQFDSSGRSKGNEYSTMVDEEVGI